MKAMRLLLVVCALGWALAGCSGSGDEGDDQVTCNDDNDPICQECPGPNDIWCYHDAVVASGDVDKCDDILKYWDDQDRGVVGSCQYEIALVTHDCSICDRIVKSDIHDSCVRDVC